MPRKGPRAKCNQCNINMLANQEPKASALFWYTQRYHTLGVMLRGPRPAIRHKETAGARAAIGGVRSELIEFCRLALVGLRGPRGLGWVFGKRLAAQGYRSRLRGYCAQPPRSKNHGKQARPPSWGCTVHAQGVESWGGSFIRREFCL